MTYRTLYATLMSLALVACSEPAPETATSQDQTQINDSEVVFVGYGIDAPEYQWNDFDGVDVAGKTIIVLVNDPSYATQEDALFTGNAMTYYGRWTYKYEEGARKGADAVFIVHETAPAAYPWSVVESSDTGSKYTLIDGEKNASRVPIMGWLDRASAEAIFAQAGLDYHIAVELAGAFFKHMIDSLNDRRKIVITYLLLSLS